MALFKAYSSSEDTPAGNNLNVNHPINESVSDCTAPQEIISENNIIPDNELFFIDSKGSQNTPLNEIKFRQPRKGNDNPKTKKSKKKSKRYSDKKRLDLKSNLFSSNDELRRLQSLLLHDENNIELWKEFITKQARNVSVGNVKAVTERQISIIEEALRKNPRNADLYEMWFQYNRKIYSHNDFTKIIIEQTEKDTGNFQLWLALIDCNQQSISECNVTVVLDLYRKAITSFKKFRHQNILNKGVLFKLFQRVTIFLRQTGSWKELIYFLQYTVWLNCSDCELPQIFKFPEISNSILIELEEAVLQSGLPLSEIWYRIESLRETFNWSTVKPEFNNMSCNLTIEEMDDLTTVFNEDITKFHLFLHVLSSLRIPILSKNYSVYRLIGLNEFIWHFDSCENILYIFHEANDNQMEILQILYHMLSTIIDGPQYWGPRSFISEYYDFALNLLKNLMDYSTDECAKIAFGLMYIRFVIMHIKIMKFSKKTINYKNIKKKVKALLSENNNLKSSVFLYIEYAKFEATISNVTTGLNTLQVLLSSANYESTEYSYLIKTYIDLDLIKNNKNYDKEHYLNILAKVVHDEPIDEADVPILIMKFYNKPVFIVLECITPHLLTPSLQENFICCGAYFIYFTLGLGKAIEYINKMCEDTHAVIEESLYEWVANISYIHPGEIIIEQFLNDAILKYPNNGKLLFAYLSLSLQWPKLKNLLSKSIMGLILLLCFLKQKELNAFDDSEKSAYKNRQSSLMNDVMKDESFTQYPLMWRIYLQYLYENGSEKIMDSMTEAIEKFPWLKSFYVSGVRYAPQDHSAFQDIIAEKELTLLALTEELEILRQDNPNQQ